MVVVFDVREFVQYDVIDQLDWRLDELRIQRDVARCGAATPLRAHAP